MFELRTVNRWTRLGSFKLETEPRPHIVPLTDEAEEFVHYQLATPYGDLQERGLHCFDPFYTGYGHAEIGNRWRLCFRFKDKTNTPERLCYISAMFERWRGQQTRISSTKEL
jgi:hypothetical protein